MLKQTKEYGEVYEGLSKFLESARKKFEDGRVPPEFHRVKQDEDGLPVKQ